MVDVSFFLVFILGVLVLDSHSLDVLTLLVTFQTVEEMVVMVFMMVELIPGIMIIDII